MLPFKSIKDVELIENSPLGEGAFSVVYKVRHKATNQQYAMKKIDILQLSKADCENLKLEIKLHQNLHQENIIRFVSCLQHQNLVYMLLEHASNGSLFFYIDIKEGLPELLALRFFYETAKGIQYLHSKGVVHRDIKPENILLDKDFKIKICDFGWSCKMEKDELRSSICGTYEYMSPEIVYEQNHNFGVDTWCLGILLYEMLHGNPPFKADNLKQIKREFEKKHIEIGDHVSSGTKDLIERLLHYDAKKRITVDEALNHPVIERNFKKITRPITKEEYELLIRYYYMNSGGNQLLTHNSVYARRLKRASMLTESGFMGEVSGMSGIYGGTMGTNPNKLSIYDTGGDSENFFDSENSNTGTTLTDTSQFATMDSEYSTLEGGMSGPYSNTYNVQDFSKSGHAKLNEVGGVVGKTGVPSEAFKKKGKEKDKMDFVTEDVMEPIKNNANTQVKSGMNNEIKREGIKIGDLSKKFQKIESKPINSNQQNVEEEKTDAQIAPKKVEIKIHKKVTNLEPTKPISEQTENNSQIKPAQQKTKNLNINKIASNLPAKPSKKPPVPKLDPLQNISRRLTPRAYTPQVRTSREIRNKIGQTFNDQREISMHQRGKPLLLRDSDERRESQLGKKKSVNNQGKSKSPIKRKKSGGGIGKRNQSFDGNRMGHKIFGSAKLMANVVMQRTTLKQFQDRYKNSKYNDQLAKDVEKLAKVNNPNTPTTEEKKTHTKKNLSQKTSKKKKLSKPPQKLSKTKQKKEQQKEKPEPKKTTSEKTQIIPTERKSNTPGLPSRITTTTIRGGKQKEKTEIRMISNQKTVIKYPPQMDATSKKNMEMLTLREKVQMKVKKGGSRDFGSGLRDRVKKEKEKKEGGAKNDVKEAKLQNKIEDPSIEKKNNNKNEKVEAKDISVEKIPTHVKNTQPKENHFETPIYSAKQSTRKMETEEQDQPANEKSQSWNRGLKVTDSLKMMRRVVIVNGVKTEKLIFSKQKIESGNRSLRYLEEKKKAGGDLNSGFSKKDTEDGNDVGVGKKNSGLNIVNSLNKEILEEKETGKEKNSEIQDNHNEKNNLVDKKLDSNPKLEKVGNQNGEIKTENKKEKIIDQNEAVKLSEANQITVIKKGRFAETPKSPAPIEVQSMRHDLMTQNKKKAEKDKERQKEQIKKKKESSGKKYRTVISLEEYRKRIKQRVEESERRKEDMRSKSREMRHIKRAISKPILKGNRELDLRTKSQTRRFKDEPKMNQPPSMSSLTNPDLKLQSLGAKGSSIQRRRVYVAHNRLPSNTNLDKSNNQNNPNNNSIRRNREDISPRTSNSRRNKSKPRVQNITNINNINIINNINNIKLGQGQNNIYTTSFSRYPAGPNESYPKRSNAGQQLERQHQTVRAKSSTVATSNMARSGGGTGHSGRQFERVERLITWEEYQKLSKGVQYRSELLKRKSGGSDIEKRKSSPTTGNSNTESQKRGGVTTVRYIRGGYNYEPLGKGGYKVNMKYATTTNQNDKKSEGKKYTSMKNRE